MQEALGKGYGREASSDAALLVRVESLTAFKIGKRRFLRFVPITI
jgi:hypothetical protein